MSEHPEKGKSELSTSKDAMHETLEHKVEGFVDREGNIFQYLIDGEEVFMHAITQQKEFEDHLNFSFQPIYVLPDNDYTKLKKLTQKLISTQVAANNSGKIYGYIFNQARSDFPQAFSWNRIDQIVNKRGFNKQLLESPTTTGVFLDKRKLEQAEIAVWALAHNLNLNKEELQYYEKYKGTYHSKIDYFNLNKEPGIIESGWFKHIVDPIANRLTNKYWFNPETHTLENWKGSGPHLSILIPREAARYHKEYLHQDAFLNANGKYELELVENKKEFLLKHSSNRLRPFKTYRTARFKNIPLSKK